ncbi:MAG TPA: glycosyl hydrolase [Thermoleophilaceae bacterium]
MICRGLTLLIVVLAMCVPAHAAAAPDPFFGTLFDDNAALTREQRQQDMDRQAAAGIGTIRHHVFWSQVETEWTNASATGVYDWRALDQIIGDAADRGLRVLPVVFSTPEFYKPDGARTDRQVPPADPVYLGRFLRKLAERYGPNGSFWCSGLPRTCRSAVLPIRAWQVWNEPNLPAWWKGDSEPDPAEYVELLKHAQLNLRLADPGAEVVMAGLAPSFTTPSRQDFRVYLNGLYDAGAAAYFDALAIHAYRQDVEGVVEIPRMVREIADAHGDTATPIWITEWGWASGGANSPFVTTPSCQAARVHAAAGAWRALRDELRLSAAIQFQWRDVATTRTAWPFHAGLNPASLSEPPKPSLGQYANAIAGRPPDSGYDVATACSPAPPPPPAAGPPAGAAVNPGADPPPSDAAAQHAVPPPPTTSAAADADLTPPDPRIVAATLRGGRLLMTVGCGAEPCTAIASASLRLPGRAFRLTGATRAVPAGGTATVRLALPEKARRALKQPRLRARARARIALRALDPAGNSATRKRTLALAPTR